MNRSSRARALLYSGGVTPLNEELTRFRVASQSGAGSYRVEVAGRRVSCECPDHANTGGSCKHILAAKRFVRERKNPPQELQRRATLAALPQPSSRAAAAAAAAPEEDEDETDDDEEEEEEEEEEDDYHWSRHRRATWSGWGRHKRYRDYEEDEDEEDEDEDEDEEDDEDEGYGGRYSRAGLWDWYHEQYGATRSARAGSLVASGSVFPLDSSGTRFNVKSQRGVGSYRVVLSGRNGASCECMDFQSRGGSCKHIIAARSFQQSQQQQQTVTGAVPPSSQPFPNCATRIFHKSRPSQQQTEEAPAPAPAPAPSEEAAAAEPSSSSSCIICQTEFAEGEMLLRLPCMHEFHRDCVGKWLATNHHCPICRNPLTNSEPHPTKRKKQL